MDLVFWVFNRSTRMRVERWWNVVTDASHRGLRGGCVVALIAFALAQAAVAQELELVDPLPPQEYADPDASIISDEPNSMLQGPPGDCYPSDAAAQGMPPLMAGDGDVPWHSSFGEDRPPWHYSPCLTRLGFRHSYTHGRNVGWGWPLGGTSWLNRPYYFGVGLGPLWLTRPMAESLTLDTDTMATFLIGWDWDYYWGSELQFSYATPEVRNRQAWDADRGDRLYHLSYDVYYYPWGDSWLRPYWRFGIGETEFDYPTADGHRYDEGLLTLPVGIGVKYPFHRWWAARMEVVDYWSIGHAKVDTQHNVALTFGVEWRFGVRSKSYWPWNPSDQIW